MTRARVLAADDHTLLVDGIRLMLEPEFELVGSVEDGHTLLIEAARLAPDVVLLDISMPNLNGLDAARRLKKFLPACKIIFVTMHGEADFVTAAFKAGAAGYVLKRAAAAELLTAIREVLQGRHYVTPWVTKGALSSLILMAVTAGEGRAPGQLTPRQREILQLVAEGKSRKEISELLVIAVKTVEFHKAAIMKELGLHNSADIIRYAISQGLISSFASPRSS
jgi:DNA-binding NarL/FixJ family response regulator